MGWGGGEIAFLVVMLLVVLAAAALIVYMMANWLVELAPPSPVPTASSVVVTGNLSNPFSCAPNAAATAMVCDISLGYACLDGYCACPTGLSDCGSSIGCVSLETSVSNCGACGEGVDPGLICCSGAPADPINDIANCNGCGNVCTGVRPACCGGVCVDTNSSTGSCGSCFAPCAAGQMCCSGGCVGYSNSNCGTCGHACGPGFQCSTAGVCVSGCAPGESVCNGECVSPMDNYNCGGICGNICPHGTYCATGGACLPNTCPAGQLFCNGYCASSNSQSSCGDCTISCSLYCNNGLCACNSAVDCPAGFSCQTGQCHPPTCPNPSTQIFCVTANACVSPLTDPLNCGGCNTQCKTGVCTNGNCTCTTAADCPIGDDCYHGLCQPH